MWKILGEGVLKYRFFLLALLLLSTSFMAWHARKVKLSYEFSKAIPTDNPKYLEYQQFKRRFGEDGNLLLIGIETRNFFHQSIFNDYLLLNRQIKNIRDVDDIISVPSAVNLLKDYETEKLNATSIFRDTVLSQTEIDSSAAVFLSLPFYKGLLYNPQTSTWLMGVRLNKNILASEKRVSVVQKISTYASNFGYKHNIDVHLSGLPLIRTVLAHRLEKEMRWFVLGSVLLSAIILMLFFRSFSSTLLSLAVVIIGVLWSFGTIDLLGYKITLLTALIPPLVVVIGIPNCIYFLNKYHTAYKEANNKHEAIVSMVAKMGVVTLFCNISAAIGFAVFALTKSTILKEFGVVAGINIMMLFFISLILIPAVLSILPPPKYKHTKYLQSPGLQRWLDRLEFWSLNHRKLIYLITTVVVLISVAGMFRLKSVGYIVDDLPKTDKIYTDLKFFEKNFKGVMPLEIVVDTKKPNGLRGARALTVYQKVDSLSEYISSMPEVARPLSIVEGLKFAKQAFFEGDTANYAMPSEYDLPGLQSYLSVRKGGDTNKNSFSRIVSTFVDSSQQQTRISASIQDVG
ncbi:MAG: MMPL family transporter, partial [Chitinophagaceae bacterium]|nr:MMPL family transporter [Chitinophagaceae bacterium]